MLTYRLGQVPYHRAAELQRDLVEARADNRISDVLLLLEHAPTITLGRGAARQHILTNREDLHNLGIAIEETDRGGDVTYHGPGQLVGYPILQLKDHGKDIHAYLRKLEDVLIRVLSRYGILGSRFPPHTGVWIEDQKIAAIGVNVRQWISSHGFALNVNPDLSHFRHIVPCGISAYGVTSIACLRDQCPTVEAVGLDVEYEMDLRFPGKVWGRAEADSIISGVLPPADFS